MRLCNLLHMFRAPIGLIPLTDIDVSIPATTKKVGLWVGIVPITIVHGLVQLQQCILADAGVVGTDVVRIDIQRLFLQDGCDRIRQEGDIGILWALKHGDGVTDEIQLAFADRDGKRGVVSNGDCALEAILAEHGLDTGKQLGLDGLVHERHLGSPR